MKRFSIILSALFVISLMFVACSEEDATELAWKNGSDNAINDIIWTESDPDNYDAKWSKDDGYAETVTTESKEVSVLTGLVECSLHEGGDIFAEADVNIEGVETNTLDLEEGSSSTYTIVATKKK